MYLLVNTDDCYWFGLYYLPLPILCVYLLWMINDMVSPPVMGYFSSYYYNLLIDSADFPKIV